MRHDIAILSIVDRARWESAEAAGGLPSQCWRYAAALALSGYEPRLAIVDADGSRLFLPYVEREWQGRTDIATIPCLSGASIVPMSTAPLERWRTFAVDQGWVTGYIQLAAETYPNVSPMAHPVHQTHMFLLDVDRWHPGRTPSLTIRRKATSALRDGAVIVEDRPTLTASLQRLYPETLARFGAKPLLSGATLSEWSRDQQNVLIGVALAGVIEGVHLIHVRESDAELHISGTSERGRELSALLYTAGIERLKTLGVTRCNLGGGGNPGDGLFMFKTWLGGMPVPLQSIRHVYDNVLYKALCAEARMTGDSSWFPEYRATPSSQTNG